MSNYEIGVILLLSAIIQASFQLSVSMMTLMSGHALGKKTAHARVMRMMLGFIAGAMIMIALMISFIAMAISNFADQGLPPLAWSGLAGLMIGVGVAVWVFYYRYHHVGTVMWLPRPFAEYLSERSRKTKRSPEAFGLGMVSVVAELIFTIGLMVLAAALLVQLDTPWQLVGLIGYALISCLPLVIIYIMVGGGKTLARVQRWRENNKRFLQFAAGSALILLGGYLYVEQVWLQLAKTGSIL